MVISVIQVRYVTAQDNSFCLNVVPNIRIVALKGIEPKHPGRSQSLKKSDGIMTVVLKLNDKVHKYCASKFKILYKNDYISVLTEH
jgi:hypothetical protein